ncbi:MAG: BrnA antitoxin family protein [Gammaproteobacteria bacterium]|nr:BrnA antitoxin family protein [Gammaproteobacteria bacterium]
MNNGITSQTSVFEEATPYDPDDPVAVAAFWEGARIIRKGKVIGTARGHGSPERQKENTKIQITLQLSPEVVAYFKSAGEGWQTRIDKALHEYVDSHCQESAGLNG